MTVFEDLFGTLCFDSPDPRPEPFGAKETIFAEMAGQTVSLILERTHREAKLDSRRKVSNVLNRVLRHNLRNELNVVGGYLDLLESQVDATEADIVGRIGSATESLLKLADQARELDSITRSPPVAQPTDVVPLVQSAVEDVRSAYSEASIRTRLPERAVALAAPELEDGVAELLDNAARFGGEPPTVAVSVETRDDIVEIRVADEGPGLPNEERQIRVAGEESSLEHGSGLGLFLVHWIVSQLDGDVAVPTVDGGTTIAVRIPRVQTDDGPGNPNR